VGFRIKQSLFTFQASRVERAVPSWSRFWWTAADPPGGGLDEGRARRHPSASPLKSPPTEGHMSKVAPSPTVVAAGSVPVSTLADVDIAEVLAPLAPLTTPARFQALVAEFSSHRGTGDRLTRHYTFLRELSRLSTCRSES
jgi:hypothetical protein